ncbi:cytidine deaminase-like protein [Aaosphaeria arxii CBS 175.79]|uniref:Cytidine deaminase-like protein n=1 Tax=Aaosphaeria arxii CBS 175.79 TaxID=1450172 RepID=A0A6A5XLX6_9PLEO|nr:cytidine deaminase-like protein [Aaosphaeria arxii CBS 175.79]KAF2014142.1 cytidine deaminase-like protein [Aaosphaeria arxii CBS 175.79]
MLSQTDVDHLRRCVALATEACHEGDSPFGSILVSSSGEILQEDRNRTVTLADPTLHPEFTLARWAAKNLSQDERAKATVYTSGEHCPMCAAAHANAGLGRIVYASSSAQLKLWREELGLPRLKVSTLAIKEVAPGLEVDGPCGELCGEIRELHVLRAENDARKGVP